MSQAAGYSLKEERTLKPVQSGSNQNIFNQMYDATKRVSVAMEWFGFDVIDDISNSENQPQVSILLISKAVKGLEVLPSNVLFKTHIYEIRVVPNEKFFEWTQRKYGFSGELQLFRKKRVEEDSSKVAYFEYKGEEQPIIQYSFEEDFSTTSSTKVFHCLQEGHCPNHLGESYPQDWQKYADLVLAIELN